MTTKIITKKQKGANRHWKNFLDKDYLGAHNLEEGEEMLLTIAKFEGEEKVRKIDGKKDEFISKQVIYFKEEVPKMIMNITNGNTIAMLYGTHPDQWVGKQIQVYAARVKAFGKEQDAIRVRDFPPTRNVNATECIAQLRAAKTLEQLAATFKGFSTAAKNNAQVVAVKDELKAKFSA